MEFETSTKDSFDPRTALSSLRQIYGGTDEIGMHDPYEYTKELFNKHVLSSSGGYGPTIIPTTEYNAKRYLCPANPFFHHVIIDYAKLRESEMIQEAIIQDAQRVSKEMELLWISHTHQFQRNVVYEMLHQGNSKMLDIILKLCSNEYVAESVKNELSRIRSSFTRDSQQVHLSTQDILRAIRLENEYENLHERVTEFTENHHLAGIAHLRLLAQVMEKCIELNSQIQNHEAEQAQGILHRVGKLVESTTRKGSTQQRIERFDATKANRQLSMWIQFMNEHLTKPTSMTLFTQTLPEFKTFADQFETRELICRKHVERGYAVGTDVYREVNQQLEEVGTSVEIDNWNIPQTTVIALNVEAKLRGMTEEEVLDETQVQVWRASCNDMHTFCDTSVKGTVGERVSQRISRLKDLLNQAEANVLTGQEIESIQHKKGLYKNRGNWQFLYLPSLLKAPPEKTDNILSIQDQIMIEDELRKTVESRILQRLWIVELKRKIVQEALQLSQADKARVEYDSIYLQAISAYDKIPEKILYNAMFLDLTSAQKVLAQLAGQLQRQTVLQDNYPEIHLMTQPGSGIFAYLRKLRQRLSQIQRNGYFKSGNKYIPPDGHQSI